jgi:hypothetical protein
MRFLSLIGAVLCIVIAAGFPADFENLERLALFRGRNLRIACHSSIVSKFNELSNPVRRFLSR